MNNEQDPDFNTVARLIEKWNKPNSNFAPRSKPNLKYGEPEEEGLDDTTEKIPLTPEQKLIETLKNEVNRRFQTIDCIDYLNRNNDAFFPGTTRTLNYNYFVERDYEHIFNPQNDANWFKNFINDVLIVLRENKNIRLKSSVYIKGRPRFDYIPYYNYMVSVLQLDHENEVHVWLAKLIKKFCNYYEQLDAEEKEQLQKEREEMQSKKIHTIFSEPELELKKELLEEDPDITKTNFTDNTIDELIAYSVYHTEDVPHDNIVHLFELVKMVVDNGDTLQQIEDLTPESDWKSIIYNWYDIETLFDDTFGEDDTPTMEVDIFDMEALAEECDKDYLKRQKSKGGQAKGTNTKAITIQNIETQEQYSFESYNECMSFLQINNKMTFNRFTKGQTKLNKKWTII